MITIDTSLKTIANTVRPSTITVSYHKRVSTDDKGYIALSESEPEEALGNDTLITIPSRKIVPTMIAMLNTIGVLYTEKPKVIGADYSTQLQWEAFKSHQMGRGCVAFRQSEPEKTAGEYDPHVMFEHHLSDVEDENVSLQVELESALLAHLLNRFRIVNDFVTDQVKQCAVASRE